MRVWRRRFFRRFRRRQGALLLIAYEAVMVFLLLGSVIPEYRTLGDFLSSPFWTMEVNQFGIAIALAMFLPYMLPHIRRLKIFGQEVELLEEIQQKFEREKKERVHRQYENERVLYAMAARMGRTLKNPTGPPSGERRAITIGCKEFVESRILAEIIFLLLERNEKAVDPNVVETPTLGCFFNLRVEKIDLYVEYSGTGLMLADVPPLEPGGSPGKRRLNEWYLDQSAESAKERLNTIFGQWDLAWLSSLGFRNEERLVMLEETASRHGIVTYEDLKKRAGRFVFAAPHEYYLRGIGYPLFLEQGFNFRDSLDVDNRLNGLFSNQFDVGVGWMTDAIWGEPGLRWLEPDAENPAISQFAMPLCRLPVKEEVEGILGALRIREDEMREMIRKAGRSGNDEMAIKGIASVFLKSHNYFE